MNNQTTFEIAIHTNTSFTADALMNGEIELLLSIWPEFLLEMESLPDAT